MTEWEKARDEARSKDHIAQNGPLGAEGYNRGSNWCRDYLIDNPLPCTKCQAREINETLRTYDGLVPKLEERILELERDCDLLEIANERLKAEMAKLKDQHGTD